MTDRVQVTKVESEALGGSAADERPYYTPIEPQEDVIESAGLYVQDATNRDETTLLDRLGSDMRLKDGNNTTPVTLSTLALKTATQIGQTLYSIDGTTFSAQLPLTSPEGWLVNNDGTLLVVG